MSSKKIDIEHWHLPTAFTENTCHCEDPALDAGDEAILKEYNESYVPTRLLRPFRPRNDKPVGRYEHWQVILQQAISSMLFADTFDTERPLVKFFPRAL